MRSLSRRNDLRKLLEIHTRTLQKLKEQQASFGLHTPAHILIEIEDKEAEIARLQKELKQIEEPILQTNRVSSKVAFATRDFYKKDNLLLKKLNEISLTVMIWGPGEAAPSFKHLTPDRGQLYATRKGIEKFLCGESSSAITPDDFPGIFPLNLLSTSNDYGNKLNQAEDADCIIVLDTLLDTNSEAYLLSEKLVLEKTLIFLPKDAEQELIDWNSQGHIHYLSKDELKTWALFYRILEWLRLLKLAKVLRSLSKNQPQQSLVEYTKTHEQVLTVLRDEFAMLLLYFISNVKVISLSQLQKEFALPEFSIAKHLSTLEKAKLVIITNDKVQASSRSDNVLTTLGFSVTQRDIKNDSFGQTIKEIVQKPSSIVEALGANKKIMLLIPTILAFAVFIFLFWLNPPNDRGTPTPTINSSKNSTVVTTTLAIHPLNSYMKNVLSLDWSPDGTRLVTGGVDNTVRIWDVVNSVQDRGLDTAEQMFVLSGHTHAVMDVSWSPNSTRIASGSQDSSARIWDARNGSPVNVLSGHTRGVLWVSWSPDSKWLATGGLDGTVRIWDGNTGIEAAVLSNDAGAVKQIIWSRDASKLAVIGDMDTSAQVWEMSTKQSTFNLIHQYPIYQVIWSPDGTLLATRSSVGAIRFWNAISGEQDYLLYLTDEVGASQITWSPDGKLLVVGLTNGSLQVWELTPYQLIAEQQRHTATINQMAECVKHSETTLKRI